MRIRTLRLLTAIVVVIGLALPGAGLAGTRAKAVDRGVVQSVDAGQIVLRALDGSTGSFQVFPGTRVRVNGQVASIGDVVPGFVAEVTSDGKRRALLVRAYGTSTPAATITERGVVIAVSKTSITLATGTGTRSVALDKSTRFRVLGAPALRRVVRPGLLVAVTHAPDAPALVVNVLKRPRA